MEVDEVRHAAAVDDPVKSVAQRSAQDESDHRIHAQVCRLAHDVDDEPDRHRERRDQEEPGADRREAEGRARVPDVGDADEVAEQRQLGAVRNGRVDDRLGKPVQDENGQGHGEKYDPPRVQLRLSPIQICSPSSISCSPWQPSPLHSSISTYSVSFLMYSACFSIARTSRPSASTHVWMRSSMFSPAFLRRSWMRRTTSRASPSRRNSSVISVSSFTSGAPNTTCLTFNSSRTIAAMSSGRGSPGSATEASGWRTLMRTASRAASPASTACLASVMLVSTSGSCHGIASGKSLRWTDRPSD